MSVIVIWFSVSALIPALYKNMIDPDSDNDGTNDYFEFINGIDPTREDTDGDGLPDNIEINPTSIHRTMINKWRNYG